MNSSLQSNASGADSGARALNSQRTAIINVVGLTSRVLGPDTPRLSALAKADGLIRVKPVLPAVTCTAQSTYLTGLPPAGHGCVANGWYDRTLAEHQFWKQSNHVVQGKKIWETLRERRPGFTCAKLLWWYNMYSSADWTITPRPMYPADARSAEWIEERHRPDLSLVYLPHLDYNLQRLGPNDPKLGEDFRAIDRVAGGLIDFYARRGVRPVVLSEYGITAVTRSIALNRIFRARGWLAIKEELGLELMDCGASKVFAIADHQVAHIYVNDPALLGAVRSAVEGVAGVARVLDAAGQRAEGLDHARSGDLVAFSAEDAWFTYYYWADERKAPDFARCVDIHRKYGYDPVELFVDPVIAFPRLKVAGKLLRKALGFRMLMDVIALDPSLVKGSHGTCPADASEWPVLIGTGNLAAATGVEGNESIPATAVHDRLVAACLA